MISSQTLPVKCVKRFLRLFIAANPPAVVVDLQKVGQAGLFNLGTATGLGEEKLWIQIRCLPVSSQETLRK